MPKTTKDFTQEERSLILKQIEELGIMETAKRNDTTWQAILALQRQATGNTAMWHNRNRHNHEERLAIWARVKEVGYKQAAEEFHMSENTLKNWPWKFGLKLNDTTTPEKTEIKQEPEEKITAKSLQRGHYELQITTEAKNTILARAEKYGSVKVARETGINRSTINNWLRKKRLEDAQKRAPAKVEANVEEVKQLPQTPHIIPEVKVEVEIDKNNHEHELEVLSYVSEPAVDAAMPSNPVLKALVARIHDLKLENIVLREKNAVLSRKLETLQTSMKELLS